MQEVTDVPRLDEALDAYGRITVTEFAPTWPAVRKLLGEGEDRYIEMAMEQTPPASAAELVKLMGSWLNIRRSWAEFLHEYRTSSGANRRRPARLTPTGRRVRGLRGRWPGRRGDGRRPGPG